MSCYAPQSSLPRCKLTWRRHTEAVICSLPLQILGGKKWGIHSHTLSRAARARSAHVEEEAVAVAGQRVVRALAAARLPEGVGGHRAHARRSARMRGFPRLRAARRCSRLGCTGMQACAPGVCKPCLLPGIRVLACTRAAPGTVSRRRARPAAARAPRAAPAVPGSGLTCPRCAAAAGWRRPVPLRGCVHVGRARRSSSLSSGRPARARPDSACRRSLTRQAGPGHRQSAARGRRCRCAPSSSPGRALRRRQPARSAGRRYAASAERSGDRRGRAQRRLLAEVSEGGGRGAGRGQPPQRGLPGRVRRQACAAAGARPGLSESGARRPPACKRSAGAVHTELRYRQRRPPLRGLLGKTKLPPLLAPRRVHGQD